MAAMAMNRVVTETIPAEKVLYFWKLRESAHLLTTLMSSFGVYSSYDGLCQHSACFQWILVPAIIIKIYFSLAKVQQSKTLTTRYIYYPIGKKLA